MQTTQQKASYCLGWETAKNLLRQFSDMDLKFLENGFMDFIKQSPSKLSQDEISGIMQALTKQVEQQQKQFFAKISQENREKGEEFLKENKKQSGVHTLTSGLQYRILEKGDGKQATAFDVVSVHYRGRFIDGTIFDSSYERGQPQVFPIKGVIPGWSEALQMMHVGDKWEIFIPHYLAYGEGGFGHEIGPCMTLIFEIELVSIN